MTPESAQDAKAGRRTGLPSWRTGKPDAFLAAAVDTARQAVETIAKPGEIGAHIGAKSEGDRVVTHLFESKLAGYGGWQWYAVVTRNSRSKVVTVNELDFFRLRTPSWRPNGFRGPSVFGRKTRHRAEELAEEAGVPVEADDDGDPSGEDVASSDDGRARDDERGRLALADGQRIS